MAGGGGAAAAAAAALARATKASGVIVRVEPDAFVRILARQEAPLVVIAQGGVFKKHWKHLASYKGLAFYTESPKELDLPLRCERVYADKIWIPD